MPTDHHNPPSPADPVSQPVSAILGRIPSGVYVLTVRSGDEETGMLASWVMQAGFDPPMVSVAVRKGRYVADWLRAGEPFVLNVVCEGQARTLRHFSRGFAPGEPAFDGLEITRTPGGLAVLGGSLGHLECGRGLYRLGRSPRFSGPCHRRQPGQRRPPDGPRAEERAAVLMCQWSVVSCQLVPLYRDKGQGTKDKGQRPSQRLPPHRGGG